MGKASPKQKLWTAFAEYIRLRDSEGGFGNCISCDKEVPYPNSDGDWHAGHLWPRSVAYAPLYFHEKNSNGQCRHCNTFLEGATMMYRKGFIKKYGEEGLEELDEIRKAGMTHKMTGPEYDDLAKEYRKKNREIKKERGIT